MKNIALTYLGRYIWQTVAVVVFGFIWVANAIALGRIIHPEQLLNFCGAGLRNIVAATWMMLFTYGFFASTVLILAFGFLSSWVSSGYRCFYALLIFLTPLFGLVAQNVHWHSTSFQYYVNEFTPFTLAATLVAAFFVPGFLINRRLTNRCTGRRAASVPLLAFVIHFCRQQAGQPLGASELKR